MTWLKWTRIRSPEAAEETTFGWKVRPPRVRLVVRSTGSALITTRRYRSLSAGRAFATTDSINAPPVAIINQTLAQKLGEGNLLASVSWLKLHQAILKPITKLSALCRMRSLKIFAKRELAVVYFTVHRISIRHWAVVISFGQISLQLSSPHRSRAT